MNHDLVVFRPELLENVSLPDVVKRNIIVSCITGSYSYGLNNEQSDLDIRGVYLLEINDLLDPFINYKDNYVSLTTDKKDVVLNSFRKYFKLLYDQNIGALELLWCQPYNLVTSSQCWSILVKNREKLLCKKVYWRISGYINSLLGDVEENLNINNIKKACKLLSEAKRLQYVLKSTMATGKISIEMDDKQKAFLLRLKSGDNYDRPVLTDILNVAKDKMHEYADMLKQTPLLDEININEARDIYLEVIWSKFKK